MRKNPFTSQSNRMPRIKTHTLKKLPLKHKPDTTTTVTTI